MNTRIWLIALLALAYSRVSPYAIACSPTHVETAGEITDRADVILLVKVPEESVEEVSPIKMTVVDVLKGDFKDKTVVVRGQTARYHGANDVPPPYDFVRPGGRSGDCFASDYKAGGHFLLFVRQGDVHWSPLAATNEEVSGASDPWVAWVKKRLNAQGGPNRAIELTASRRTALLFMTTSLSPVAARALARSSSSGSR